MILANWYHKLFPTQPSQRQQAEDIAAAIARQHRSYKPFQIYKEGADQLKIPIPEFINLVTEPRQRKTSMLERLVRRVRRPQYEPLERIVRDSVNAYNLAIDRHKRGVPRALQTRYSWGAAAVGVEVTIYKDALREHVASSKEHYIARRDTGNLEARVEGYAQPASTPLARFDRTLLPDYNKFADEVAELYVERKDLLVKDIAAQMTEKYGMSISTSYVSTVARGALMQHIGYTANRREAQKQWRHAKTH